MVVFNQKSNVMQANLRDQYLSKSLQSYLVEKSKPQLESEIFLQLEECVRFLYLSSLSEGSIPVGKVIDDIWHLLILETREYEQLCLRLPGKKFIHHTSDIFVSFSEQVEEETQEEESRRQLEWLVSYVANFGDFTKESLPYWTYGWALCQKLNVSVEQFNVQLKQCLR